MTTMAELLNGVSEQVDGLHEERKNKHRVEPVKRPDEAVNLEAIYKGDHPAVKTQLDPTVDLVEIMMYQQNFVPTSIAHNGGFLILCQDTRQVWFAPDEICLNANFIYRDDLTIVQVDGEAGFLHQIKEWEEMVPNWYNARKTCYILDNPADESYEVYYDPNYPKRVYGKTTPDGMFVHRYQNRFHRDMSILELDMYYAVSSKKAVKRLQHRKFAENEAIIVSDGCWMANKCGSSFVYLDNKSLIHMTEGYLPSDEDQAVLISEIRAALNAVEMCASRGKKVITYYYDNTSILNVFKNKKTEYIEEVSDWKHLLSSLSRQGYTITFIELHPKNPDESITENKALMFFHNMCDGNCRNMCELVDRSYVDYVKADDTTGKQVKTYNDVRPQYKKPPYKKR